MSLFIVTTERKLLTKATDIAGYSDPFCVVVVGGKKVFTTNVKKKTLFPKWNETVTTELTKGINEITIVSCELTLWKITV